MRVLTDPAFCVQLLQYVQDRWDWDFLYVRWRMNLHVP